MLKEKIESIDKTIAEWENERSTCAQKFEEVKEAREIDYHDVWVDYLALDFPFKGTYLRVYNGRMEIHRDVDDRNRRELMTVYFREDWETKEFTELNTSVYSSSEDSQWELERLTTVGAVAKVLLDHYDDILTALNTIKAKWSEKYSSAFAEMRKADNMISNWQNEKNKLYLDHAKKLLMSEGLTFTNKLASLDIRHDYNVRDIQNIKVTDFSTSGKTCTIEVEQYFSYYDEVHKQTFKKVRTSKLDSLYWQYRDYILKTEAENQAA